MAEFISVSKSKEISFTAIREVVSYAHMLTMCLALKYEFTWVAAACVGVALFPLRSDLAVKLSIWLEAFSGLITARVAKQLQQLGPCRSRGGLVVQPARVSPVMDLHLPPVTFWPSDLDTVSIDNTAMDFAYTIQNKISEFTGSKTGPTVLNFNKLKWDFVDSFLIV